MVRAWMLDTSKENERPLNYVDIGELTKTIGVRYWKLDADLYEADAEYNMIKKDRGYSYRDIVEVSPATLSNYGEMVKIFFTEHLHADEEVRFVLAGSGYFDVRDYNDKWVRIAATKGDMIMLPAGIYHRFSLDSNNYIKAQRLFAGDPVWTAYNRPSADHCDCRRAYVRKFLERSG